MKSTNLFNLNEGFLNLTSILGLAANDQPAQEPEVEAKGRRLASAETRLFNLEKLLNRKLAEFDEDFKVRETDILALQDAISELNHDVHNLRLINAIKNGKVHVVDAETGDIIPFKFEN